MDLALSDQSDSTIFSMGGFDMLNVNLMNMKDSEKKDILDVLVNPVSLFGDAVESECFLETQKQIKGISQHFMLKHAGAPPPTLYRSLSVRHSARTPASSASAPCREPEPAVKPKVLWP